MEAEKTLEDQQLSLEQYGFREPIKITDARTGELLLEIDPKTLPDGIKEKISRYNLFVMRMFKQIYRTNERLEAKIGFYYAELEAKNKQIAELRAQLEEAKQMTLPTIIRTRICAGCGKEFTFKRQDQRCCSVKCRMKLSRKLHPLKVTDKCNNEPETPME